MYKFSDNVKEIMTKPSLRDEIRVMLKEFIPLSANYCVEDLTSAILEAIKKRVPKKHKVVKALVDWCETCDDAESACGYNQAIDDFTKGLE